MGNFGPVEMLFIAVFALLVFGPQRLPEIARSIGRAIREFKKVSGDFSRELQTSLDDVELREAGKAPKKDPNELRPGPR